MADRMRTHRGTKYVVSAAHPAAEAFPWLDDDDLQALADDIAANGQRYKVVKLSDGRVIDGRNRELACRVAGVVPEYRTEDMDDAAVVAFVVSANIHRRDLTVSQRAMIAAELANMKRGGKASQIGTSADLKSQEKAAEAFDVSVRSVGSAAKVKDKAPELVEAVKGGELDVKTAAKVADLPKPARKKVAKAKDKKKAAKDALEDAAKEKADAIPIPAADEDPENPAPDPRFMPNAAEAAALAQQFANWRDRLRSVHTELKRAFPKRGHVVAGRINADEMLAQIADAVETLDKNVPDRVCPVCVGTGAGDAAACKFCDGYGIVDRHHHAGLKAKWKHTRARLDELRGAA